MSFIEKILKDVDDTYCITKNTYDSNEDENLETVFTLSNGYLGLRGATELDAQKKCRGTYIAGVYDKLETDEAQEVCGLTLKNKAITPAYAIVPDTNILKIEIDGVPFDFINCEVLKYNRTLDMKHGIVINCYVIKNRFGKTIEIKTLTVVSKTEKNIIIYKVGITPIDFDGKVTVKFENSLCTTPQFIPRLKDYISKTDLKSINYENDICKIKSTVSETNADIFVSSKTIGLSDKYIEKSQNGISEVYAYCAQKGKTESFTKFVSICEYENNNILEDALSLGEEAIFTSHFQYWENAWKKADIKIEGDDEVLRGIRWNIFNLTQLGNEKDDISISATGLHGQGYFGHIFWDTEIFMLPFYLATNPEVAKNLLMYRYNRLDKARKIAKNRGLEGAAFPWTSTATGEDVTPPDWERCANRQIHISGDVSYAFHNYYMQTGDFEFYKNYGIEVLVETAKFYASKAQMGTDNKYHILDVIGPDEYNIHANDNYYTNHLVSWNIKEALVSMERLESEDKKAYEELIKRVSWNQETKRMLSDVLENMAYPQTIDNVNEQYDGFFKQKDPGEIPRDEYNMPLNKNYQYDGEVQILKQADVVMMHYIFPEDFSEDVKRESFKYYEKRCIHGSSLSPSIHCITGLRNGFDKHAYNYLYLTALLDLKNLHLDKNLHEGLHTACAGGTWAATVYGFGGIEIKGDNLHINPTLPEKWNSLKFSFINKGVNLNISVSKDKFCVIADKKTTIYVKNQAEYIDEGEVYTFNFNVGE